MEGVAPSRRCPIPLPKLKLLPLLLFPTLLPAQTPQSTPSPLFQGAASASAAATPTPGSGPNNGIVNALHQGVPTVLIDPAYPFTDHIGFSSPTSPTNRSPVHVIDLRNGFQVNYFSNLSTSITPIDPSPFTPAADDAQCNMSHFTTPYAWGSICRGASLLSTAPGWSLGNPSLPPSNHPHGWTTGTGIYPNVIASTAGIFGGIVANVFHTGVGDTINYFYARSNNGFTAASDEGVKALAADTYETSSIFTGTLLDPPTGNQYKTRPNGYPRSLGQGQYIIDRARQMSHGHVTAIAKGLIDGVSSVTLDGPGIAPSNAWGILLADIATPLHNEPPFSTSQTITVDPKHGAFDTTHLVCIASQFHDCAVPTSVTLTAGLAVITLPLRRPHQKGGLVMQGGAAGTGIELTANTVQLNPSTPLRYLEDVFGSIDGHTVEAALYKGATLDNFYPGSMNLGVANLTHVSSSGPTLSATLAGGSLGAPTSYQGATFTLTGASDPALNGPCANLHFTPANTLTCTIDSLSGSHTAPTAQASLANNAYTLWPMAETLDIQNYATNPISIDGTLTLEPNIIPAQPGDTFEQTHHASANYSALTAALYLNDPYALYNGAVFQFSGAGIQAGFGGGNGMHYPGLLKVLNGNPAEFYTGSGGSTYPPDLMVIGGYKGAPYADGIYAYPGPLRSFLEIDPSAIQKSDPAYRLTLLSTTSANGFLKLSLTPFSNATELTAYHQTLSIFAENGLTLNGRSITLQSPVTAPAGISTRSLADTTLIPGHCVQASAGGVLTSTPGPCAGGGSTSIPAPASTHIPLRFVGTLTTTAAPTDTLPLATITPANHCSAQPTNQPASTLPTYLTITRSTLLLHHATPTPGATYDLFCDLP
jgi:hypothetical protein